MIFKLPKIIGDARQHHRWQHQQPVEPKQRKRVNRLRQDLAILLREKNYPAGSVQFVHDGRTPCMRLAPFKFVLNRGWDGKLLLPHKDAREIVDIFIRGAKNVICPNSVMLKKPYKWLHVERRLDANLSPVSIAYGSHVLNMLERVQQSDFNGLLKWALPGAQGVVNRQLTMEGFKPNVVVVVPDVARMFDSAGKVGLSPLLRLMLAEGNSNHIYGLSFDVQASLPKSLVMPGRIPYTRDIAVDFTTAKVSKNFVSNGVVE